MRTTIDDESSVIGAAVGSASAVSLDSGYLAPAPGYASPDSTAPLPPFNSGDAGDWSANLPSNSSGDSRLDDLGSASRMEVHTGVVFADPIAGWPPENFTGSGMSDILWRNVTPGEANAGEVDVWITTTATPDSAYSSTPQELGVVPLSDGNPTDWYLGAVGDLGGDGKADMVWVNAPTGEVDIWNSNPGSSVSFTFEKFAVVPTSWVLQESADFNGDGHADLIWRDEPGSQFDLSGSSDDPQSGEVDIWLSNGISPSSFTPVNLGVIPMLYQLWGVGDFNGDGRADLVWFESFTGDIDIWTSTGVGNSLSFNEQGIGLLPPAWDNLVWVGDFEGAGRDNLLWENRQTGELDLWSFTGTSTLSVTTQVIGQIPLNWTIVAVGDFNGDGKASILWENTNTTNGGFPPHELDLWLSTPGPGVSFTYHEIGFLPFDWTHISPGFDHWF